MGAVGGGVYRVAGLAQVRAAVFGLGGFGFCSGVGRQNSLAAGLVSQAGAAVSVGAGVMAAVMVCGSRQVSAAGSALVGSVAASMVQAGRSLSVGCASGVDQAALSSAVEAGAASSVQVFAVGGPCGAGFAGKASNVAGVQAAGQAGASVVGRCCAVRAASGAFVRAFAGLCWLGGRWWPLPVPCRGGGPAVVPGGPAGRAPGPVLQRRQCEVCRLLYFRWVPGLRRICRCRVAGRWQGLVFWHRRSALFRVSWRFRKTRHR